MKTYVPSANAIEKKWYVVDATDKTLGRLASEVATVLRGKNKPIYTPFLDCGDYVIPNMLAALPTQLFAR